MTRNKNVEAVRGIAILGMLVYHYMLSIPGFGLSGKASIIVEGIGQFALISFFVISGFGSYTYFSYLEENNESVSMKTFLKKRLTKILPQYYLNIFVIIFLTSGLGYLSTNGIGRLLSSLLLVQNFFASGSVNGVTWTIAVLFQLYVVVKPLYYGVKKFGGGYSTFFV